MVRKTLYGVGALIVAATVGAPAQVERPAAPAPPSYDRLAAEWVLRLGGNVVLAGDPRVLRDLADLPSGDFEIHTINLVGTLVEPQKLELLGRLSRLRELNLPASMWNPYSDSKLDANDDFKHLAGLTELEKLSIDHHFLELADRSRPR